MAREEEPNCKWITRLTKRILETPDRFRILQLRKPSIPPPWSPARSGGLRTLEAVRRVRPPTWSTSQARPPAGHLGIWKTIARIGQRNCWPGLFRDYMANRPDESSEAEGILLGERAGHRGQYPRTAHRTAPRRRLYCAQSLQLGTGQATPPNAGGGDMEAFHGADADWGSDEEELKSPTTAGFIGQGAGDRLPLLGDDEYLEELAAAGDVEKFCVRVYCNCNYGNNDNNVSSANNTQHTSSSVSCECVWAAAKQQLRSAATHHQQQNTWCARVNSNNNSNTAPRSSKKQQHTWCARVDHHNNNNNNSNTAPRKRDKQCVCATTPPAATTTLVKGNPS
ncbi:hypothetical protein ACLKA7_005516 [Drosophila subpalustris]